MSRYKAYEEYKESGVEWLGEIPKHWEIKKLKFLASVYPSNVDKKSKEDELPIKLCNYTDVYYNEQITNSIDFMSATATAEQIKKFSLKCGDTLITKDSEDPDDIAIPAYVPENMEGIICGYHLAVIRPDNFKKSAYIKRLFESTYAKSYFSTRANGLTRYGLGTYALINIFYPNPPNDEAGLIANFLDHETAKIDSLIEKQQQLIKLLKEKRQAVISYAVTKGLNPNAKMRDSGVEWLGEIPKHWEIKKLKFLASVYPSNVDKKSKEDELPIKLCNYTDVYYNEQITNSIDFMNATATADQIKKFSLKCGDTLITKDSEDPNDIAIPAFVPENREGIICGYHLAVIRPHNLKKSAYIKRLFESTYAKSYFSTRANGLTRYGLGTYALINIFYPNPPNDEACLIADFLGRETAKIDTLIEKVKKAIELLKERRTALISAAVTGKIDVKNWQSPKPSNNKETIKENAL